MEDLKVLNMEFIIFKGNLLMMFYQNHIIAEIHDTKINYNKRIYVFMNKYLKSLEIGPQIFINFLILVQKLNDFIVSYQ